MHSGPCAAAPNSLLSQLLLLHYTNYIAPHGCWWRCERAKEEGEKEGRRRMDIHTAKIGAQIQPRSSVAAARRMSRHLSPWPGPIRFPSEEVKGSLTNHNSSSFPFTSNQRSSIPNCLRLVSFLPISAIRRCGWRAPLPSCLNSESPIRS